MIYNMELCSFLDKAWEIDEHLENQDKLGSMAKSLECTAFGKLCFSTDYIYSRQNPHKSGLNKKRLKDNIDFTTNYDGENPIGFPVHGESFFILNASRLLLE